MAERHRALARDLVMRGSVLFARHGAVWEPKAERDLPVPEAVARHRALLTLGSGSKVAYRDGRQGILSGRGRWGQVEVALDDGTRMWWQDKDVQAVGSPEPERAARSAAGAGSAAAADARADSLGNDALAG